MAYQSLYRRYRPGRFVEVKGQEHVVRALRSAVRDDRVGHAYLFSGPRGTGKTSTARILAKALNCETLDDGEPCGVCDSCRAIEAGTSYDLHELDAASNNGVDAIRDLISRAALGSPGRTKVYILDEVHMLSAGASNALLKTLEEPPPHVVFVLATTDPHKVLPTIRSRAQHYEFGLLSAEELSAQVRWIVADAGLDVDEAGVAHALRAGGGSARDTLSALDQVVAAGGVPAEGGSIDGLVEALCEGDGAGALVAVADALAVGREPRPLAEELLAALRDVFLASVAAELDHLTEPDRERARDRAGRIGRAAIVRALELVGEAIAEMRHVGDPRIPLEVALVRLTRPEVDTSLAALVERVARLERALADGGTAPAPPAARPEAAPPAPARPGATPGARRPADAARRILADQPGPPAPSAPAPAGAAPSGAAPSVTAPVDAAPPDAGPLDAAPPDAAPVDAAPVDAAPPDAAPSGAAPTAAGPTAPVEPPPAPTTGTRPAGPSAPRAGRRPAPPSPAPASPGGDERGDAELSPAPASPGGDGRGDAEPAPAPASPGADERVETVPGAGGAPTLDAVTAVWEDGVLATLSNRARARYRPGRLVSSGPDGVVVALPNSIHRDRCEDVRPEVEAALARHLGAPVTLRLVVGRDADVGPTGPDDPSGPDPDAAARPRDRGPATKPGRGSTSTTGPTAEAATVADVEPDDDVDLDALVDAEGAAPSAVERVTKAFPGAQPVTD